MRIKRSIKVAVKRGNGIIVGTLTPPEKEGSRWVGKADDGKLVIADTAEECADKLNGIE